MYCIKCGIQIPKNSKFCSHCGKQQNEGDSLIKERITKGIIETKKVRHSANEKERRKAYQFIRKAIGWYSIWILIQLGILLIASDGIFNEDNMGIDYFWPLANIRAYDITEFLFYTIFPIAIMAIGGFLSLLLED